MTGRRCERSCTSAAAGVLDVVIFGDEDEARFVGLLQVEATS